MNSFIEKWVARIKQFFQKVEDKMEHPEDEEFIDDTKASMLTKVTPVANIITYFIIIFFIVGIVWASFSQIDVVVTADGKVIPSTKVKTIQSLDGGIVNKLLVEEGTLVKKDQALLILDDIRYKSDFDRNYQKSLALQATIARLNAELENKHQIDFSPEIKNKYPELAHNEMQLFDTRQQAYAEQLKNLEENYSIAKKELVTYANASKEGIVSKLDYYREMRIVGEAQQRILELKNKHWEDARNYLVQANSDLNSLEEELKGLRDKMERTTLRSPVDGIVKKINVSAQYEVISPYMVIMEIVPVEDTLLVQVRVKPSDIAFIHIGQEATIHITAYDYSIYGKLDGKVEYVSADAIEETKPGVDKVLPSYYLVNIRTIRNYLGNERQKLSIFPGMDAQARIVTGKKSIIHYLLKPLVKAKEEALRER